MMDALTFDRWTTAFAARPTRRAALRLLAGGVLAPLLSPRQARAARQGEGVCFPEQTLCGASCADLLTDPLNCGSCGTVCDFNTEFCQNGQCVVPEDGPEQGGPGSCDGGLVLCDGACVDPFSDPLHCGACQFSCVEGAVCQGGVCTVPGGGGCLAGSELTFCNGVCVDLLNDSINCGACGVVCSVDDRCIQGFCSLDCVDRTNCAGVCIDTINDPLNCGFCGNVCAAGVICQQGACVPGSLGCYAGFTDCAGSCVDLLINPFNCGACGVVCEAGSVCYGGICTAPRDDICQAGSGLTDCRGFCVDLLSNAFNCGACGHGCVPDTEVCRDGVCAAAVDLDCASGIPCGAICCNVGERCVNDACVVPVTCADGRFDCGGVCCAAGETCVNGACVLTATCAEGDFACGAICCTSGMHICDDGECIRFS
jgi:hypothetical protein